MGVDQSLVSKYQDLSRDPLFIKYYSWLLKALKIDGQRREKLLMRIGEDLYSMFIRYVVKQGDFWELLTPGASWYRDHLADSVIKEIEVCMLIDSIRQILADEEFTVLTSALEQKLNYKPPGGYCKNILTETEPTRKLPKPPLVRTVEAHETMVGESMNDKGSGGHQMYKKANPKPFSEVPAELREQMLVCLKATKQTTGLILRTGLELTTVELEVLKRAGLLTYYPSTKQFCIHIDYRHLMVDARAGKLDELTKAEVTQGMPSDAGEEALRQAGSAVNEVFAETGTPTDHPPIVASADPSGNGGNGHHHEEASIATLLVEDQAEVAGTRPDLTGPGDYGLGSLGAGTTGQVPELPQLAHLQIRVTTVGTLFIAGTKIAITRDQLNAMLKAGKVTMDETGALVIDDLFRNESGICIPLIARLTLE